MVYAGSVFLLINASVSGQYFENDDSLRSEPKTFFYEFGGERFVFTTDAGVFSNGRVDANTEILLQNIPAPSGSLLDLGCGYGCIGIILARKYKLKLTQSDVSMRAVALAELNCRGNGVRPNVLLSDGFNEINEKFDCITLNPPIHAGKEKVFELYDGAVKHLNANGKFYVVISKRHGAESSVKKLNEIFGGCETLYKRKGCLILCCAGK